MNSLAKEKEVRPTKVEHLAFTEPNNPKAWKQTLYDFESSVLGRIIRPKPPARQQENLLNLGCGPHHYEGWVNADHHRFTRMLREKQFRPDWLLNATLPWNCQDDYWDGIFCQHVLEHFSYKVVFFVLSECFRTLKPGCWVRVSTPDIWKFIDPDPTTFGFQSRPEAISYITHHHGHSSVWDPDSMTAVLRHVGFDQVRSTGFGVGSDPRLVRDEAVKARESLYVEGRKPGL